MVFVIYDWICSTGKNTGGDPGAVAEVTRCQNIRATKQVCKTVDDRLVFPPGAVTHDYGFSPKGFFILYHPFRNSIQGFIPRNALPFSTPLWPHSFHGMRQSIRMIS
ncbi:hypothetical protein ES703_77499 [subsurface metagenome]